MENPRRVSGKGGHASYSLLQCSQQDDTRQGTLAHPSVLTEHSSATDVASNLVPSQSHVPVSSQAGARPFESSSTGISNEEAASIAIDQTSNTQNISLQDVQELLRIQMEHFSVKQTEQIGVMLAASLNSQVTSGTSTQETDFKAELQRKRNELLVASSLTKYTKVLQ